MMMVRSLASRAATTRRLVFMVGIAVALIAGLLAMHTLTAGNAHLESAASTSSAADQDHLMVGAAVQGTTVDTGHCLEDCGVPGNVPNHSILMVCVLALLAAAVISALAPALLARLSVSPGVSVLVADRPPAVPRPHPPSLLVLSISRT